jgi:hypothetical protein
LSGEEVVSLWLASLGGRAWLARELESLALSTEEDSLEDAAVAGPVLAAVVRVARKYGAEGLEEFHGLLREALEDADG